MKSNSSFLMKLKTRYLLTGFFGIIFVWSSVKLFSFNLGQQNRTQQKELFKKHVKVEPINVNQLFHFGGCLLKEAGKKIVEIRNVTNLKVDRKEKDNSVVTKADFESHTILTETLKNKFQSLKINSEENDQESPNFNVNTYMTKCDTYNPKPDDILMPSNEITVWIDPLDATQEYSENLVEYVTVMFCITYKGESKAGIIHNPFLNKTVSSFFENKQQDKSSKNKVNNPRIIVSRSHTEKVKEIISKGLQNAQIITAGGSGYKTLSLLDNKADLYLHSSKIYKWDLCAPNAILNNLGGKLTERNGKPIDYSDKQEKAKSVNGIIASLHSYDYFFDIFKL